MAEAAVEVVKEEAPKAKPKEKSSRTKVSAAEGKEKDPAASPKPSSKKKDPATKKAEAKTNKDANAAELASRKDEARKRLRHVRALREQDSKIWEQLAEELYEIKERSLYLHMRNPATGDDYKSFADFAKNEAAWSERQANYLIAIWRYFVIEHDLEFFNSVKHLGWSKLLHMIGVLNEDNKESVVAQIDGSDGSGGMSVKEVKAFSKEKRLKEEKASSKKSKDGKVADPGKGKTAKDVVQENPKKRSFALYPTQYDNLDMAIATAKKITGSESDAEALDIISLDFQSHHVDSGSDAKEAMLRNVESAMNGKLLLLADGDVQFMSKGQLSTTEEGREADLLGLVENQLGCDLVALRKGEVSYLGLSKEDGETSVQTLLKRLELLLGVSIIAIRDEAIIHVHPELEPLISTAEE